jgi:hypothetical protein
MSLRGLGRTRNSRSLITCALALLQLHIFWVTVFHHHDSLAFPLQPSTIQEGSQHTPLAADASLLCTACQIMRHGAAQPTVAFQLPAPATLVPFLPKRVLIKIHSLQQDAFNGRAPPFFS